MIKRPNELGELNRDIKDEAGYLIKALTSQGKILERYRLDISQSQSFSRDLKRKRDVGKQGCASQWDIWVVLLVYELLVIGISPTAIPISIYTIYKNLTGVETKEVPSVNFSR